MIIFYKKISYPFIKIYNKKYETSLRKKCKVHDFSIICSNCMGGCISHRLGEPFNSPTVNLWIGVEDFVKFASDLRYYVSLELVFIDSKRDYPVGQLDDITIHFNHSRTEEEAREQWERRKQRIRYDNLYIILVGDASAEVIKEFEKIDCRNRVVLCEKNNMNLDYVLAIKPHKWRIDGSRYMDRDLLWRWSFEKNFNYVKWINDGAREKEDC